jgi:gentisate 1,2-dioxygenase
MATDVTATTAEDFHERMHASHMYGLWELASQMTPSPAPKMLPYMWPSSLLTPIVQQSSEVVPVGN